MKFLVDECAGPALAKWLTGRGHDVFSVFEKARGISDDNVIKIAFDEKRIIITTDKDFGELIFRKGKNHCGVVLLRLADERSFVKIETIDRLLNGYSEMMSGAFIVVTENQVRFAR